MDPFEVRMQFLSHLRKLDAKQETIQKVVSFALKHAARCGDDLWDCILEECTKGNVNMRINILYMLDALCETSLLTAQHQAQPPQQRTPATLTGTPTPGSPGGTAAGGSSTTTAATGSSADAQPGYVKYVARDVDMIVELVVPDEGNGILNLVSTRQVLENWRTKRIIDPTIIENVLQGLEQRRELLHNAASTSSKTFVQHAILARFNEDRERHKRLRERRWAQPVSQLTTHNLAAFSASSIDGTGALDVEFADAWETTSDWNEDDDDAAREENGLCFGSENAELRPKPRPAPEPQLSQPTESAVPPSKEPVTPTKPPLSRGEPMDTDPLPPVQQEQRQQERTSMLPPPAAHPVPINSQPVHHAHADYPYSSNAPTSHSQYSPPSPGSMPAPRRGSSTYQQQPPTGATWSSYQSPHHHQHPISHSSAHSQSHSRPYDSRPTIADSHPPLGQTFRAGEPASNQARSYSQQYSHSHDTPSGGSNNRQKKKGNWAPVVGSGRG